MQPVIPITQNLDPIKLLTDDATIARWNNEGLPSDKMSTENAIILTNSDRWPLLIDPQLQGIKWIKAKYGEMLRAVRLDQKNCLEVIESAILKGETVLIESIPENLDPVLDPLIGKNLIKKGHWKTNLFSRLSSAGGNFLGDTALVENLEHTKATAQEIQEKAFRVVFHKAIERAEVKDDVDGRVKALINTITYSVFQYTTRGLFEKDKLIFSAQMTFQILSAKGEIGGLELDYLLRFPTTPNVVSPLDFISNNSWGSIRSLSQVDEFRGLDREIEGNPKRWRVFCESEAPEKEKLPGDWKNKTDVQQLCIMRAVRPDRMTHAIQ
ncbi:Dynein heavy chain 14, axonemal [Armadillidium vulgare]|nr:Dynein heavy chain 14, axonemal [Armadillidium vulgare]